MLDKILSYLKEWLPVIVPVLAIVLGLWSFWAMHWRKGQIGVSTPRSFVAAKTADRLVVELPLSFYNNGAASTVINNLLLEVRQESALALMRFEFTRTQLGEGTYEWAKPIVVEGRKAVANIFNFQSRLGELTPQMGAWNCRLFGQTDSEREYYEMGRFKLNVKQLTEKLTAQDNFDEEYQRLLARRLRAK